MNSVKKRYMTVEDVASYLSVSQASIYRWVSEGSIPFVKMRGLLRFIDTEIDEWMLSNSKEKNKKYLHLIPKI
jgi:PTS system nitrogen regulatory IIA component